MAHNIHSDASGKHAFFSNGPAWHKLGQTVQQAQSWEEAMKLAKLDWEVEKVQLTAQDGNLIPYFGIFRKDKMIPVIGEDETPTGELIHTSDGFLGAVGAKYQTIQNKYAFDFVDAILESDGGAHYESAGALGNGGRIFCLAKTSDGFDLHGIGDKHDMYFLFTTAHDGSASASALLTGVRVVCQNTLQMALSADGKNALKIPHTKSAHEKLEQARALIGSEKVSREDMKRKLEILAERRAPMNVVADVMKRLYRFDKETGKPTVRSASVINEVLNRFESNDGDAFPQIRGTAYNLLNAFTEYTDHHRPVKETSAKAGQSTDQIRADNAMFGGGADFKRSVLDTILDATKHCRTQGVRRPLVAVPGTEVIELEANSNASLLDQILDASMPVAA